MEVCEEYRKKYIKSLLMEYVKDVGKKNRSLTNCDDGKHYKDVSLWEAILDV